MASVTDTSSTASPSAGRSFVRRVLQQRELSVFFVVVLLATLLALTSKNFLNRANLNAVILGLSFDMIMAVGMTILMVSGGFDLSVGAVLALAGAVAGYAMAFMHVPWPLAVVLGLMTGAFVGLLNGLLVSKVKVNPLIATLGMMQIARGAVFLLTSGLGIPNLPQRFNEIAQGKLFGLQFPVYVMVFCVIVGDILLRRSRYFRQSYFVGGNERSARLSGIRVSRVQIANYMIAGLMAAVSGLLLTARFGSASVSAGNGAELRVISAVVIGGASLAGGEGTILGAFLGVTLMALINNGLNLLGINVYWQTIVIGAVLIIAVAADSLSRRNRS